MEPKMSLTSLHQTAGILPHPHLFTQVSEQHSCRVQQGSSGAGKLTWANRDEELGPHLACLRWGGSKLCFSLHHQSCSTILSPLAYLVLMLLEANSVTEGHFNWTMLVFCLWKSVQLMETGTGSGFWPSPSAQVDSRANRIVNLGFSQAEIFLPAYY